MSNITTAFVVDTNVLPILDHALTFGDTTVRQPDFVDCVAETAAWIGEDGAVEVPLAVIDTIARLVRSSGHYARCRQLPKDFGITMLTFDPDFTYPAFAGWSEAATLSAWAEFAEILTAA